MRTYEQFLERLKPYKGIRYFYCPEVGYMAWQRSTGDNYEEILLEAHPGKGREVYRMFCAMVKDEPPYYSVFAYVRNDNVRARSFYRKMGFREVETGGIYTHGLTAVLYWIPFAELKQVLGVE